MAFGYFPYIDYLVDMRILTDWMNIKYISLAIHMQEVCVQFVERQRLNTLYVVQWHYTDAIFCFYT